MKYVYITFALILALIIINISTKKNYTFDISNQSIEKLNEYCKSINANCHIEYQYSNQPPNSIINQNIKNGTKIKNNENITITISKGTNKEEYQKYNVNELGRVPIMMYHGIHNLSNQDTNYTKGNVDKDGYQRTTEAFIQDLEFYYQNGYRMIKLKDYIEGIIDVELGYSPIIITFDDGLKNNFNVLGLDDKGELIIDPNSAVGILEKFKQKYPDYNITATFFLNETLFEQPEYNEKILNWLIKNNYDIGNHTLNHVDFSKINTQQTKDEINNMYNKLETIIGKKYVNILALPFGSPYKIEHENFKTILESNTTSTLRVGWESDYSPFSKEFNKTFIKRIRAYDNNGTDFDIEYNFKLLEKNRYISDGNKDQIVFPAYQQEFYNDFPINVITY